LSAQNFRILPAAIASLFHYHSLKYWQPKHIFRFVDQDATMMKIWLHKAKKHIGQIAKAWSPFAILTVMVTIWSVKPFKDLFTKDGALHDIW
jgi:L-lactate permease